MEMLQQTMSALLGFQQPTTAANTFPSFGRVGCCEEGCTGLQMRTNCMTRAVHVRDRSTL